MKTGMYGCVLVLFCVLAQGADCRFCPGFVHNGRWDQDYKDGDRCILRCDSGYEPSGCHVIRGGTFPTCQKASPVPFKTIAAVGVGAAAVVAAPFVLTAAGFGAAGVALGSVAAWFQGPATVAGSWFALSQSAGAAGIAVTTNGAIFGTATTAAGTALRYFTACEQE